jgi:hypothetical protein
VAAIGPAVLARDLAAIKRVSAIGDNQIGGPDRPPPDGAAGLGLQRRDPGSGEVGIAAANTIEKLDGVAHF